MTRRTRLLIAIALLALPVTYGWHNATESADKAIRQYPDRFADPEQLRSELGARGATGGFIVGVPLAIITYICLAVFRPR